MIKLDEFFDNDLSQQSQDIVRNYEEIANKQTILTLCRTSGSTGPPKVMMYPNKTWKGMLQFPSIFNSLEELRRVIGRFGFGGLFQFLSFLPKMEPLIVRVRHGAPGDRMLIYELIIVSHIKTFKWPKMKENAM